MTKRTTIGLHPLDVMIPKDQAAPAPNTPARDPLQPFNLRLPASLAERVRRAAFWTPGASISRIVTAAVTDYLDEMEKDRGEPFPEMTDHLVSGRRIKRG